MQFRPFLSGHFQVREKIKYAQCFGYVIAGNRNLVLLDHNCQPSAATADSSSTVTGQLCAVATACIGTEGN
jgi:hypothetical protein